MAALLAFMTTSGIVGKRNIEGIVLDLTAPDEVYAGVETLLQVRLANRRRRLPSFLLRVELNDRSALAPFLPCGSTCTAPLTARFPRRGRQRIATLLLASRFPVAFFRRARALAVEREIIVFPAPRPVPAALSGSLALTRGHQRNGPRRGQVGELAKIVGYTGNEPLKRIHWKHSARQDELMVKELEEPAGEPVIIDPRRLPGPTLEEQLSQAVWLIDRLLRRDRPVGLVLGGVRIPPAAGRDQKLRLLRELALYGN